LLIQGGSGTKSVSQNIPLSGSRYERFVLSGWNKASDPSSSGGAIAVALTLHRTDGRDSVVSLPFASTAHGWTFGDTSFSSAVAFTSATLTATVSDQTGSLLFDDLEIARTWTGNPGFESGLAAWTGVHLGTGDGVVTSPVAEGAHALALTGSEYQVVQQNLGLAGGSGRTFVLSGWNRTSGTSAGGGRIDVTLRIGNADGTVTWFTVPFARAPHGWVYAEGAITTTKAFTSVIVQAVMSGQTGAAYFDRILVRNG